VTIEARQIDSLGIGPVVSNRWGPFRVRVSCVRCGAISISMSLMPCWVCELELVVALPFGVARDLICAR
jgi:hypothetical protein